MTDYEKFKLIYEEIDKLITKRVTSKNEDFITWHTKTERFIRKKYGEGLETNKFLETRFSLRYGFNSTHEEYVEACILVFFNAVDVS